MDRRRRLTAAAGAVLMTLLLAACTNDPSAYPHGEQSATQAGGQEGDGVSTLAVYGLALVIAAVIGLLAYLPGALRASRYRPTAGWTAAPVWFAGPSDPVAAVEQATTGDVTRGGTGGDW